MSDGFTDEDRKMLVETHTKVEMMETAHTKILEDHESRLRKGERFRYTVMGIAASSGAGCAALIEGLKGKIGL